MCIFAGRGNLNLGGESQSYREGGNEQRLEGAAALPVQISGGRKFYEEGASRQRPPAGHVPGVWGTAGGAAQHRGKYSV